MKNLSVAKVFYYITVLIPANTQQKTLSSFHLGHMRFERKWEKLNFASFNISKSISIGSRLLEHSNEDSTQVEFT